MSKYTIDAVEDFAAWDAFVDASPQGTLFSHSGYLRAAVGNWRAYWIRKGNQIKGGLCLVLDERGEAVALDDLVIHNGLLFAADGDQKATKARLGRFEISEFAVDWLSREYDAIELALSPQVEDMRPFLWHNYHSERSADKFELDLRYTSYVDLRSLASCSEENTCDLFRGLETLRQRNIREARKVGATTAAEGNGALFADFYAELMRGQGEEQDAGKLERMARLVDHLIADGQGAMLVTRNPQGDPIYATVFGWDAKRAYYLFGASAPGAEERYMGTIAFWDAYCWLARRNIHTVDMEGVNSPRRGWFKLSFGGDLRPYYQVYKHA